MEIIYLPKTADFIVTLDQSLDGRVRRMLKLLEDLGYQLRMPFSKPVGDGIFELRVVGAVHIRFLYFFHKGHAVVVHAFIKKTEQLSRKDIDYALRARRAFIADI